MIPILISSLALLSTAEAPAQALPFLSPMFGDHMVLQRGKPNTFWGWTQPGAKVSVTVGSKRGEGVADASGKWSARVTPPPPGGPYEVTIEGPVKVELKDVLVGDVWLCSGQSNMEMGVGMAKNASAEIAAANEPNIRLYMAPRQVAYQPLPTNNGKWKICTPETIAQDGWEGFSAVGYFFGRELHRNLNVPVGLIQAAWGGTSAEAWASEEGIRRLGDFDAILRKTDALRQTDGPVFGTYTDYWLLDSDPGSQSQPGWQAPELDDSSWQTTKIPDGFEGLGLQSTDGVVWFRKEIDLTDPLPQGTATLALGRIDETDTTWLNGKLLGNTSFEWATRRYSLPAGTLKPGRNVLAVRVFDTRGRGGFLSTPGELYLELGDGTRLPLAGDWKGKLGVDVNKITGKPYDREPNPTIPAVLYNGMIAPVAPLAIRGAIWYQGETNSGRSYQYRRILPSLISDWRRVFSQGDFPFYIVGLASFMPHRDQPSEDGWTELREAQALTAFAVPKSGIVVTTDIGDAEDVHPKDKQTVGHRLALIALAQEYKKRIPYSGPVYRSMKREGASIRLSFDHTDGGLVAKGGVLKEFAIAGADRKWQWAEARIEGNAIVVRSPKVPDPVAVRYAWQSNPETTLYNGAGLPAVPFRTDDWPGVTANNK